jgi:hypothetical protein
LSFISLDHFLQFLELKIETDNMGQALPGVTIAHDLQLIPWVTLRSAEIAEQGPLLSPTAPMPAARSGAPERQARSSALCERDPPARLALTARPACPGGGAGYRDHSSCTAQQRAGRTVHTAAESVAASRAWRATMRLKSSTKAAWAIFVRLSNRLLRVSGLVVIWWIVSGNEPLRQR